MEILYLYAFLYACLDNPDNAARNIIESHTIYFTKSVKIQNWNFI